MFGIFKCAAAVPEIRVGDTAFNAEKIIALYLEAADNGAAAVVFPELCISSYTCGDLFFNRDLLANSMAALEKIIASSAGKKCIGIVGLPVLAEHALFNCAAVFGDGEIYALIGKSVLPNYREFYEKRQFKSVRELPGMSVVIGGKRLAIGNNTVFESTNGFRFGVEICEDLWGVIPVSSQLALSGAEVIFNPSAGTELVGKAEFRRKLVAMQSARIVGGYVFSGAGVHESTSDMVFGGHAFIAENGRILEVNQRFQRNNSIIYADIDVEKLQNGRMSESSFNEFSSASLPDGGLTCRRIGVCRVNESGHDCRHLRLEKMPFVPADDSRRVENCREILQIQTAAMAKRWEHTRAKKLVIGLSGGLDSTLAALVCAESAKLLKKPSADVLAITMPGFGTGSRTRGNAEKLAELLGMELRIIPIAEAVKQHFLDIGHDGKTLDITYENAQARERTQILMDVANKEDGIVVGTGDLSEIALGWSTFNGDQMSMYNVNASVPKTLIKYLVEFAAEQAGTGELRSVLLDVAATPISPELLPPDKDGKIAQKTENIVGRYILHDFFLYHFIKSGFGLKKLEFLADCAFAGEIDPEEIHRTLELFARRFIGQQFKRHASPEGPKVGTIALSPRGDWRMPADVSPGVFKTPEK